MQALLIEQMTGKQIAAQFNALRHQLNELRDNYQPKEPIQYTTRKEVADMFGVSTVTVSEWTKKGLLKSYKLGNRVYYKRAEVDQAVTEIRPADG